MWIPYVQCILSSLPYLDILKLNKQSRLEVLYFWSMLLKYVKLFLLLLYSSRFFWTCKEGWKACSDSFPVDDVTSAQGHPAYTSAWNCQICLLQEVVTQCLNKFLCLYGLSTWLPIFFFLFFYFTGSFVPFYGRQVSHCSDLRSLKKKSLYEFI